MMDNHHTENAQEPIEAETQTPAKLASPDKLDFWIALVLVILALAAYVRTLAPDILYGDSAEFQCLSYTLGITHSTGYPTYLFLGRLIGFLPINNMAWRISLLSALGAAVTVAGVYLLARYFTRSRVGAVLGSLALGISYTLWSQAVIAEVYTPGTAFLVMIMMLLCHWQTAPQRRNLFLLAAALLAGIGVGVHASVWLVAPPAVALVAWTLWKQRATRNEWIRSLSAGLAGAILGLAIFLVAFLISDQINSPTSFIRTTLEPSQVFWKLQPEDFNSPFKHLKMTMISAQWGDALFPGGDFSINKELQAFIDRLTKIEFPLLVVWFGLAGVVVMLLTRPALGAFFPLAFLFSLYFILNYQVWDKYVFYLSLYIPLAVAIGTGMGFVLEWVNHRLEALPGRGSRILSLLPVLFFVTMVIQPTVGTRWQALRKGITAFVTEDYVFPVKNLKEPRFVGQMFLTGVEDNAVLVMDWRAMYTTAYLAHVEMEKTDMLFKEAMPAGNDGKIASSLVTQLTGYLHEGRPVYVEQKYPGLEQHFRMMPAFGNLYKLSLRK